MWLDIPGFTEKVNEWWKERVEEGSASFMFAQKLKALKERIVKWRKEQFRGLESKKTSCLCKLKALEQQ